MHGVATPPPAADALSLRNSGCACRLPAAKPKARAVAGMPYPPLSIKIKRHTPGGPWLRPASAPGQCPASCALLMLMPEGWMWMRMDQRAPRIAAPSGGLWSLVGGAGTALVHAPVCTGCYALRPWEGRLNNPCYYDIAPFVCYRRDLQRKSGPRIALPAHRLTTQAVGSRYAARCSMITQHTHINGRLSATACSEFIRVCAALCFVVPVRETPVEQERKCPPPSLQRPTWMSADAAHLAPQEAGKRSGRGDIEKGLSHLVEKSSS
jgi:hypothetical protein